MPKRKLVGFIMTLKIEFEKKWEGVIRTSD
jgi:hypothetical protein